MSAVMDEQWSFVGTKKKPRWLFYAYDRVQIKSTVSCLWSLHQSNIKSTVNIIGKRWTQRIERHNLNYKNKY
ncbi:TPA: IS1 family transposase [Photobacterium damselae]